MIIVYGSFIYNWGSESLCIHMVVIMFNIKMLLSRIQAAMNSQWMVAILPTYIAICLHSSMASRYSSISRDDLEGSM